jgi:hypothetical protein
MGAERYLAGMSGKKGFEILHAKGFIGIAYLARSLKA